jgi:DNA-binding MarR family transcriptional regulator
MERTVRDRKADIQKVSELGPALSKATIFFHEALSGKLGLNATDTKCMGFIINSKGSVTAGDIARFTGLTTGAVTGVIDRLEKIKLIERFRDIDDRRKVHLRANKEGVAKLIPMYSSLRSAVETLIATYTSSELEAVGDFLKKVIHILESETEKLRR